MGDTTAGSGGGGGGGEGGGRKWRRAHQVGPRPAGAGSDNLSGAGSSNGSITAGDNEIPGPSSSSAITASAAAGSGITTSERHRQGQGIDPDVEEIINFSVYKDVVAAHAATKVPPKKRKRPPPPPPVISGELGEAHLKKLTESQPVLNSAATATTPKKKKKDSPKKQRPVLTTPKKGNGSGSGAGSSSSTPSPKFGTPPLTKRNLGEGQDQENASAGTPIITTPTKKSFEAEPGSSKGKSKRSPRKNVDSDSLHSAAIYQQMVSKFFKLRNIPKDVSVPEVVSKIDFSAVPVASLSLGFLSQYDSDDNMSSCGRKIKQEVETKENVPITKPNPPPPNCSGEDKDEIEIIDLCNSPRREDDSPTAAIMLKKYLSRREKATATATASDEIEAIVIDSSPSKSSSHSSVRIIKTKSSVDASVQTTDFKKCTVSTSTIDIPDIIPKKLFVDMSTSTHDLVWKNPVAEVATSTSDMFPVQTDAFTSTDDLAPVAVIPIPILAQLHSPMEVDGSTAAANDLPRPLTYRDIVKGANSIPKPVPMGVEVDASEKQGNSTPPHPHSSVLPSLDVAVLFPSLGELPPDFDKSSGLVTDFENEMTLMEGLDLDADGSEHLNYLRNFKGKVEFGHNYDIIFEVGPEKLQFPAHLAQLATVSSFFKDKFKAGRGGLTNAHPKPYKMQFEKLEPVGFEKMLNLLYTNKWEPFDVRLTQAALEAARAIEFTLLENRILDEFRSNINVSNAPEYYHLAITKEDEHLKAIAVDFIKKETWEVFYTKSFADLPEEVVKSLLMSNDYYLEEKVIFEAVKNWAIAKLGKDRKDKEKISGSALRTAMGPLMYCIRFPLMPMSYFFRIKNDNEGLFEPAEIATFIEYIHWAEQKGNTDLPQPRLPDGYISTPRLQLTISMAKVKVEQGCQKPDCQRGKGKRFEDEAERIEIEPFMPAYASTMLKSPDEEEEEDDDDENENEDEEDSVMEIDADSGNVTSPEVIDVDVDDVDNTATSAGDVSSTSLDEPKPKKRRMSKVRPASSSSSSSSLPPNRVKTLAAYAKGLLFKDKEEVKSIEVISETLLLAPIKMRVHLPNLKEFTLRLIPKSKENNKPGTSLKNVLKCKLSSLEDILFFRKTEEHANVNDNKHEQTEGEGNEVGVDSGFLGKLLSLRVNITITVDPSPLCPPALCTSSEPGANDVMALKINHDEGIIIMHFVKCAQKIIDGASHFNFPLKVLAISDCDVTSLDPFRKDLLEVLVIRRVKGLKNRADVFRQCSSLREVCWYGCGVEKVEDKDEKEDEVYFSECLLRRNKGLKKISLSKCKFDLSKLRIPEMNYVEELYLDNCIVSDKFLEGLGDIFPYLKRIQLYSLTNTDFALQHILRMKSIEWIFLWELEFCYTTNKKIKIFSGDTQRVQEFLCKVLRDDKVKNQSKVTFILEKKKIDNLPGTSSSQQAVVCDSTDPDIWSGRRFRKSEQYEKVSEVDYVQNSYDYFYPSYKLFAWSDSTQKNFKSFERRVSGSVIQPAAGPEQGPVSSTSSLI